MPPNTAKDCKNLHTPGARAAKNAGFTLLELMVVVVIVGIVAVAAYPQYRNVQTRIEYDNIYSDLRSAVARCRTEALGSAYPSTVPTALTIFANGYGCVAWWDRNADMSLGNKGTLMIGDLDTNGLNGEVRHVFFQKKFIGDREYSDNLGEVFVDFAKSRLPTGGAPQNGYSFVVAGGGYLLAPNLTAILDGAGGGPAGIALAKRDGPGGSQLAEYSVLQVYPSGQIK